MDNKVIELIKKYPNDSELGNAIRRMYFLQPTNGAKIYESPDKGKTIYSRIIGTSQRTLIKDEGTI
jgi:hypothetical protein